MTRQLFLSLNGIMFVPFGLLMLLIPDTLFPMLDIELDGDGLVIASTVGSMLLSFGLICWLVRKVADNSIAIQAILMGNLLFHSIDSFLTGKAAFMGTMNQAGFIFSSMHLVFALGFAYYLWRSKKQLLTN